MQDQSEDIAQRNEELDRAEAQLKEEFIGIDEVIGSVISSIRSWYLYPYIQEKPVIVNLWGMTGVGKSALIKRLSELLDLEDRSYRFELRNPDDKMEKKFEQIHDNGNGAPFMVTFDEFQHARTIDEAGQEKDNIRAAMIWDLLDSGEISFIRHLNVAEDLLMTLRTFHYLLSQGVRVEKGKVVRQKELFYRQMPHNRFGPSDQEVDLLYSLDPEDLMDIAPDRFEAPYQVGEELARMNERDYISFLEEMLQKARTPKKVDCRKALIFVIGNVDEAYSFGEDHDPEMDPDELRERTRKLTAMDVKKALRDRFRSEQLARLGNTHILYPTFDTSTYEKLIQRELERIQAKVRDAEGLELFFDASVNRFLYEEGVFPTQGTRPVFTTIQESIESKLGSLIAQERMMEEGSEYVELRIEAQELIARFRKKNGGSNELRFQLRREIGAIRDERQEEAQAVGAVHEAGHAVLGMVLTDEIPQRVLSRSVNKDIGGLTSFPLNEDPFTKRELEDKGKVLLGGLVAEESVFGKEQLTIGSQDDLQKAGHLSLNMLKKWGMGPVPAFFYSNPNTDIGEALEDRDGSIEQMAREELRRWKDKARAALERHWDLFIALADRLSDERKLGRDELWGFLEEKAPELHARLSKEADREKGFRGVLKERAAELEASNASELGSSSNGRGRLPDKDGLILNKQG